MTTKTEQIIAIDLGNGTTSYIAGNEQMGSYASLVAEFSGSKNAEGYNRTIFKLKNGKQYLIGDDCREEGAISRSTDSSYYGSEQIQVLFKKALRDISIKSPFVVTGLPTEFFDSQRKEFETSLRKWAKEEDVQLAGVMIIPQYVAALFDPQLLDENGVAMPSSEIMKGKFGVIDIGHGTTDAGQFVDGKGSQHRFGMNRGVSDFHKDLLRALQGRELIGGAGVKKGERLPNEFVLDKQTNEHSMDTWMKQGFIPWRGEKLDIYKISQDLRRKLATDTLVPTINQIWGTTDMLTGMACAGGGMKIIGRDILKEHIKTRIFMAEDPSLSIVRGLFRRAKLHVLNEANRAAKV